VPPPSGSSWTTPSRSRHSCLRRLPSELVPSSWASSPQPLLSGDHPTVACGASLQLTNRFRPMQRKQHVHGSAGKYTSMQHLDVIITYKCICGAVYMQLHINCTISLCSLWCSLYTVAHKLHHIMVQFMVQFMCNCTQTVHACGAVYVQLHITCTTHCTYAQSCM